MENEIMGYYGRLGAAYVRGISAAEAAPRTAELRRIPFGALTEEEIGMLFCTGMKMGLKMYRFKRTHEDLPRVRRVLGILKSLQFRSLMDVGSGRGVFLLPFLDQFPWVSATAVDIRKDRTEFLETLHRGGIENLLVRNADICSCPFPEDSVDVVTMLEVLEHIHLLTKQRLTELFQKAGCARLHFDGVNGHLILIAVTGREKDG